MLKYHVLRENMLNLFFLYLNVSTFVLTKILCVKYVIAVLFIFFVTMLFLGYFRNFTYFSFLLTLGRFLNLFCAAVV